MDTIFNGFVVCKDGMLRVHDVVTGDQTTYASERDAYIATINILIRQLAERGR